VPRGRERDAGVDNSAFARLAFNRIAEDQRCIARLARFDRGGKERAARRRDKAVLDP